MLAQPQAPLVLRAAVSADSASSTASASSFGESCSSISKILRIGAAPRRPPRALAIAAAAALIISHVIVLSALGLLRDRQRLAEIVIQPAVQGDVHSGDRDRASALMRSGLPFAVRADHHVQDAPVNLGLRARGRCRPVAGVRLYAAAPALDLRRVGRGRSTPG